MGVFLGVAIGDALGAPFEKMAAEQIAGIPNAGERYFGIGVNPDPFPDARALRLGQWTDDTQLTLAVAQGFIPDGTFNMDRIAQAHVAALEQPFGWGRTTRKAVERLKEGAHWSASAERLSRKNKGAGNGVVMKIAPIGLATAMNIGLNEASFEERIVRQGLELGRMTHGHPSSILAGMIHAMAIALLARSGMVFQEDFLRELSFLVSEWEDDLVDEDGRGSKEVAIALVGVREFAVKQRCTLIAPKELASHFWSDAKGAFTAWSSLGIAYTCFFRNPYSISAMTDVIRCGGDTDSNASIVGALLGAMHGAAIFPNGLIEGLENREVITGTAERFYQATSIQA